jgi:hypothetical protein
MTPWMTPWMTPFCACSCSVTPPCSCNIAGCSPYWHSQRRSQQTQIYNVGLLPFCVSPYSLHSVPCVTAGAWGVSHTWPWHPAAAGQRLSTNFGIHCTNHTSQSTYQHASLSSPSNCLARRHKVNLQLAGISWLVCAVGYTVCWCS